MITSQLTYIDKISAKKKQLVIISYVSTIIEIQPFTEIQKPSIKNKNTDLAVEREYVT